MPARPARAALAIVLALALFPALAGAREPDPLLPDAIILPGGQAGLIMVVNKAEQRLLIYRHDGLGNVWLERIVPCSTGMVQGDKLVRGDKKTPEGFYVFRQKLLPSELPDIYGTLAYPMDYPNFWDRKIGRGGDGIWTHGINKPLVDYDSNGCIEMLNHDIAALEAEIRLHDTPILVYEDLALERSDLLREEGDGIAAFVEAWRQAWTASDIARYASFYDRGFFNTDELPFQGWMDRKARVAAGYRRIEVGIADLRVFRHRDTVVASFTQSYRGDDRFQSVGHKRLYIKGGPGDWRIVAEEYGPLPGTPPDKWLTAQEKRDALTTPPLAVAQLSEPMASASAGVILPSGPTLVAASQPQEPQSEAQAAADEATRVSLEQTTRNQGPGVTVLASLASQEGPDDVSSDSGLSRPLVASASSGVALPATAQTAGNGQDAPPGDAATREAMDDAAGPGDTPREPGPGQTGAPAAAPGPEPRPAAGLTAEAARALLAGWLAAWEAKDEEAYFSFYAPDFHFKDLNLHLSSFRRYRSRRFREAGAISVRASDVEVSVSGDRARLSFSQRYQSDRHVDQGLKTLELGAGDGQWRIIAETFQARP